MVCSQRRKPAATLALAWGSVSAIWLPSDVLVNNAGAFPGGPTDQVGEDGSLTAQQNNGLQFPVLSDVGNALASQLGILLPARTPELRAAQEKLGTDLHAVNADGTENLPMPTVVLMDAQNTIRWIDIHPDHTARTEVADILTGADSALS